jgi:hypothetical protein
VFARFFCSASKQSGRGQLAGEASIAQRWHDRALAGYLQSADRGEVHYYHHLADYFPT